MTTTTGPAPVQPIDDWAGSPLSTVHRQVSQPKPIRIEQYPDGTTYVIRLELPGIEPARDLEVSVQTGVLSVRAERRDETGVKHDSEFGYGTFARHVALPAGSNPESVTAAYRDGILTVRIGMEPEHQAAPRVIPVKTI
jgi:HSP20 family protein